MPSETDDYVPLSGLQHVVFCERQAALIHVERLWRENVATTEGKIVHQRADKPGQDVRRGVRLVRAMPLRSAVLGVIGQADTVEYHQSRDGTEVPFPVEYKRGRAGRHLANEVQLCAQAFCLEEIHGVAVRRGALFYDASHRRVDVEFSPELKEATIAAAHRLHQLVLLRLVPAATHSKKCGQCSLAEQCMPEFSAAPFRAASYIAALVRSCRSNHLGDS
jgi:CRISPR-associated exonuclease Cas4